MPERIQPRMFRPCFLVIDREYAGSISTRKLVIETAKFNVLSSYSAQEALAMLQRYPAVNGIVMDAHIDDMPCRELVGELRKLVPQIPVIVVAAPSYDECPDADIQVESFQPAELLAVLKRLYPEDSYRIERHNEDLSRRERS